MEIDESIVERYIWGESLSGLAKELGIPFDKLKDHLISLGIHIRTKTEALQKYVKYNTCVICGREFRAREKWNSGGNLYRETCSKECLFQLRSKISKTGWTEERREKMRELFTGRDTADWNICKGDKRPNWKGGKTSYLYRHIAFDKLGLKPICVICGSRTDILIHHKDKNRANNTIKNIMVLCKPCHTRLHNQNGDCGWGVYNKKKGE